MTTLKDAIVRHFVIQAITEWIEKTRKDKAKMSFLTGYKAYIVGILTLVLIALHLFGINIPGVDYTAVGSIGAALTALFARNGASTDAAKAIVAINNGATTKNVASAKAEIAGTK